MEFFWNMDFFVGLALEKKQKTCNLEERGHIIIDTIYWPMTQLQHEES